MQRAGLGGIVNAGYCGWLGRCKRGLLLSLLIMAVGWMAGSPGAQAQSITVVSGNNQTGTVGTNLPNPLIVRVRSGNVAMAGVTVTFAVTLNNGSVIPTSAVTDSTGRASTTLMLGTAAGTNRVVASAANIGSV